MEATNVEGRCGTIRSSKYLAFRSRSKIRHDAYTEMKPEYHPFLCWRASFS